MRRLLRLLAAGLLLTACGSGADTPAAVLPDGFVVADGTTLPLPAFPAASPYGTSWHAALQLDEDADLRAVSEGYAAQAADLGFDVQPVECVDREGVGSGSPQVEEANPGGSPVPGAFCAWSAVHPDEQGRSLTWYASVRDQDDRDGALLIAREARLG